METLTIIKVEVTVMTQEADPVTIIAKGKETKTETETTTDIDKTSKTKTTATPNADTTYATKNNAEKMRHTRSTLTTKAIMDKTLTFWTKAMTMPLTMNFTLLMKSLFMTQTRPMARKKMTNLPKIQMTQAWLVTLQKAMKIQNQWLKRLTKMLLSLFKVNCWIPRLPNLSSHTRNWLPSQNCTHIPQRSSSKMTHSPTSLSWFRK